MNRNHAFWGVVPAAGVGKRMGADIPKQYLPVLGKPVLQHTLERLLRVEALSAVVVALGKEDGFLAGFAVCQPSQNPRRRWRQRTGRLRAVCAESIGRHCQGGRLGVGA